jgi:hypothetical protein
MRRLDALVADGKVYLGARTATWWSSGQQGKKF